MKKLISILVLLLSLTTHASATSLKEILDDYQYTTSVEWDQENLSFLTTQQNKMMNHLQYLLDQGKISKTDLLEELLSGIKNKDVVASLKLRVAQLKDEQEFKSIVIEIAKHSYSTGASFRPLNQNSALALLGMITVVLILSSADI